MSGRLPWAQTWLLVVVAIVTPATVTSGLDPASGITVLLLAVLAAAVAAMRAPDVAPLALVVGPSQRGPHEIRPLRVTDPDAAGRGARPRAPGGVAPAPAR